MSVRNLVQRFSAPQEEPNSNRPPPGSPKVIRRRNSLIDSAANPVASLTRVLDFATVPDEQLFVARKIERRNSIIQSPSTDSSENVDQKFNLLSIQEAEEHQAAVPVPPLVEEKEKPEPPVAEAPLPASPLPAASAPVEPPTDNVNPPVDAVLPLPEAAPALPPPLSVANSVETQARTKPALPAALLVPPPPILSDSSAPSSTPSSSKSVERLPEPSPDAADEESLSEASSPHDADTSIVNLSSSPVDDEVQYVPLAADPSEAPADVPPPSVLETAFVRPTSRRSRSFDAIMETDTVSERIYKPLAQAPGLASNLVPSAVVIPAAQLSDYSPPGSRSASRRTSTASVATVVSIRNNNNASRRASGVSVASQPSRRASGVSVAGSFRSATNRMSVASSSFSVDRDAAADIEGDDEAAANAEATPTAMHQTQWAPTDDLAALQLESALAAFHRASASPAALFAKRFHGDASAGEPRRKSSAEVGSPLSPEAQRAFRRRSEGERSDADGLSYPTSPPPVARSPEAIARRRQSATSSSSGNRLSHPGRRVSAVSTKSTGSEYHRHSGLRLSASASNTPAAVRRGATPSSDRKGFVSNIRTREVPVGDGGQEAYTPTYDDEEYEYGAFEVEEDDEYPVSESQVGSLRLGEHDASTLSAALETRFNKPTLVRNTLQAPATPPSFALTESAHPVPVARYSSAVYSAAEMGEISVIRRSTSVPELTEVAGLDLPSRPPPRKKVAAAAQSSMPLLAPAGMLKSFMAADDPRLTPALRERMMDVLERSRWALWKKQQLEVRSFMRKQRDLEIHQKERRLPYFVSHANRQHSLTNELGSSPVKSSSSGTSIDPLQAILDPFPSMLVMAGLKGVTLPSDSQTLTEMGMLKTFRRIPAIYASISDEDVGFDACERAVQRTAPPRRATSLESFGDLAPMMTSASVQGSQRSSVSLFDSNAHPLLRGGGGGKGEKRPQGMTHATSMVSLNEIEKRRGAKQSGLTADERFRRCEQRRLFCQRKKGALLMRSYIRRTNGVLGDPDDLDTTFANPLFHEVGSSPSRSYTGTSSFGLSAADAADPEPFREKRSDTFVVCDDIEITDEPQSPLPFLLRRPAKPEPLTPAASSVSSSAPKSEDEEVRMRAAQLVRRLSRGNFLLPPGLVETAGGAGSIEDLSPEAAAPARRAGRGDEEGRPMSTSSEVVKNPLFEE